MPVTRGAHLQLCPLPQVEEGAAVAIYGENKQHAMAVGITKMSTAEVGGSSSDAFQAGKDCMAQQQVLQPAAQTARRPALVQRCPAPCLPACLPACSQAVATPDPHSPPVSSIADAGGEQGHRNRQPALPHRRPVEDADVLRGRASAAAAAAASAHLPAGMRRRMPGAEPPRPSATRPAPGAAPLLLLLPTGVTTLPGNSMQVTVVFLLGMCSPCLPHKHAGRLPSARQLLCLKDPPRSGGTTQSRRRRAVPPRCHQCAAAGSAAASEAAAAPGRSRSGEGSAAARRQRRR